jgi:hypothetical protein
LFGLALIGLAVSMWPDVIPGRVSIWEAAAPYSSQLFMLVGASVLIPLILAYTHGPIGCSAARSARRVIIEPGRQAPGLVRRPVGGERRRARGGGLRDPACHLVSVIPAKAGSKHTAASTR